MFITDQIDNICLFELNDSEALTVKKVLTSKLDVNVLIELANNSFETTRRALEEIIDLIGFFFKYGDNKIESIVLTT